MRFTFFTAVLCGCSGGVLVDAGLPDSGPDSGRPDAGRMDAGLPDAGRDAGVWTGCTCGDSGVCGTGELGNPLRCCNYQEDSCFASDAGACAAPKRCSPRPTCCFDNSCNRTISCQGTGVCAMAFSATAPPDGTPCDDGRSCSKATPDVVLPDCVGTDAGPQGDDCRFDYVAAFPPANACPRELPSCSGRGSFFAGQGGAMTGGKCCPAGMACDFRNGPTQGKCLGNMGRGTASNDVCRAGVCSTDDVSACP